jgi:HEAT repeat protein
MTDDLNMNDMEHTDNPEKPNFDAALAALPTIEEGVLPAAVYYGLSGLEQDSVDRLKPTWGALSSEQRRRIIAELTEAAETNFELDYHALGRLALYDDYPPVRAAAIDMLWEDESPEFMKRLVELAQWDEAAEVRAAAISALGHFILLGEYGDISQKDAVQLQDLAVGLLSDENEDVDVRRRALEAVANSSHEGINEMIETAYAGTDRLMRISAIFAMGRTCDERWRHIILRELSSSDTEMRYEAARAVGELELVEAVPSLGRLAVQGDRETQQMAIWSLGEIGGREARRLLGTLAQDAQSAGDSDLLEVIEDAIGSASLVGDHLNFDFDDHDD